MEPNRWWKFSPFNSYSDGLRRGGLDLKVQDIIVSVVLFVSVTFSVYVWKYKTDKELVMVSIAFTLLSAAQILAYRTLKGALRNSKQGQENIEKSLYQERMSEELLQEAQKIARIGSWRLDVSTQKFFWTKQMYEMFPGSVDEEEPSFAGYIKAVHEEDRVDLESIINRCIGDGDPFTMQFRIKHGDHYTMWLEIHGRGVKNEVGEVACLNGTCQDITEKKEMEREVRNQQKIASHQAKLAAIGELAAGVGHEINNPLAIIVGYLSMLEDQLHEQGVLSKRAEEILEKIRVASERIDSITRGLRTFSRIDDSKKRRIFLGEEVERTVDIIRGIYKSDGIKINLSLSDAPVIVSGNPGQLQQVTMNLLSNARDATEGLGSREISVIVEAIGPYGCIHVEDNGPGVPPALKERIFEPFYTTKDINKGTGLGLALAHSIVREHEGELILEDGESRGARFRVAIPLLESSAQGVMPNKLAGQTQTQQRSISRAHVLIVDDDEGVAEVIADALLELGLTVEVVSNGRDALALVEKTSFDLIVTDMKMPAMSGIQLIEQLRQRQVTDNTKIVVITGGVNIDLKEEDGELASIIDGYLFKPFDRTGLHELILGLLEDPLTVTKTG